MPWKTFDFAGFTKKTIDKRRLRFCQSRTTFGAHPMPRNIDIERLVGELEKMKAHKAFKTFIDYIVFPRYRNIAPDTRIDFGYPITVLVGQNGSGKTAVLQALYGAPGGSSVARWWFETAVDPIIEPTNSGGRKKRAADLPSERRSAFYYSYQHHINNQRIQERYVQTTLTTGSRAVRSSSTA
jgi:hypothetical protein